MHYKILTFIMFVFLISSCGGKPGGGEGFVELPSIEIITPQNQTPEESPSLVGLSDDSFVKSSKNWSWGCSDPSGCTYRYIVSTSPSDVDLSSLPYESDTNFMHSSGNGLHYLHIQARSSMGVESKVNTYSVILDNSRPTLSISTSEPEITENSPFVASFSFSEDVSDFALSDINVVNGTAGNLDQISDSLYEAKIFPSEKGVNVSISVGESAAIDLASNGNLSSNVLSRSYVDLTPPSVPGATISSGNFSAPFNVRLTKGAETDFQQFRYTLTGTAPTNCSSGIAATTSQNISIPASSTTLKAIACDETGNASGVMTRNYTFVDTGKPTVTISSTESSPTENSPITVTFQFNENVTGFILSDIAVGNGTAGNFVSETASRYKADITPSAEGVTVTVNVGSSVASDGAGNGNLAAAPFSIFYTDLTPPGAPIAPTSTTFNSAFTLNLASQGEADFDSFRYNLTATPPGNCSEGIVASPSDNISIPESTTYLSAISCDDFGLASPSTTRTYTYVDITRPTVAISSLESSPTENTPITVTIQFSEDVTGFILTDIAVVNGTAGNFIAETASRYKADITPATKGVTVTVDVGDSVASDGGGNGNFPATQFSIFYTDLTPPGAPIAPASTTFNSAFTLNLASQGEADFDSFRYNLTATPPANCSEGIVASPSDNISIPESTTYLSAISCDDFGLASPPTTRTYTYVDITRPTLTIDSSEVGPTTEANPIPVYFDFSEDVTGFEETDIGVINGSVDASSLIVINAKRYMVNVIPAFKGALVTVSFGDSAVNDLAGNGNEVPTNFTITYVDVTAPSAPGAPASTTFFAAFNIQLTSGGETDFDEFRYTLSGTAPADCTDGIAAIPGQDIPIPESTTELNAISCDDVDNASPLTTRTYTFVDNVKPTVTISSAESGTTESSPFSVTFTFNEDVTGFDSSDIVVGNGTAGNFVVGNAYTYTADITPSNKGVTVTVDVGDSAASDGAGNGNSPATQFSILYTDLTPPGVPSALASTNFDNKFTLSITSAGDSDFQEFRYTLDGNDPANCSDGIQATESDVITIPPLDTTLKAISCDDFGNASSVMTRTYTFVGGWEIEITTTVSSQLLELELLNPTGLEIDWGDGGNNVYTVVDKTIASHTYVNPGIYKLVIKGDVNLIRFSPWNPTNDVNIHEDNFDLATEATAQPLVTKILSPVQGITGLNSFDKTFVKCTNLAGTIPNDLFSYITGVTNFKHVFHGASILTSSIPENLFANHPGVTDFMYAFKDSGVTGNIPENLFAANTVATGFRGIFQGATGLTGSIPANLFANNTEAQQLNRIFYGATGLTGSIPATLFTATTKATTFFSTFKDATGLTGSIPDGFFATNSLVTDFGETFNGATGLSGPIPSDLFHNDIFANVLYFDKTFMNLSGLTGNAPEIWNETMPAISFYNDCFTGATNLDNYNSIPAAWGGGGL